MPDSEEKHQWYTNKELFEKISTLNDSFVDIRSELRETRSLIKRYNGLREELSEFRKDNEEKLKIVRKENEQIQKRLQSIIDQETGKNTFLENFRNWGGWFFALITLLMLLYDKF